MKRLVLGTLAAIAMAGTAAADPVLGVWKTEPDDGAYGHVEMSMCGAAICGILIRSFDDTGEIESKNIGKTMVIDMIPQGDGYYEGSVWRPSNDKIYVGKMELDGDMLALKGCVMGGLFCAAQDWRRVN